VNRPPTGIRGIYGGVPTRWIERGETLADYGVNAVWIGSGSLTAEAIALLREQGAYVYAEFNTMHDAAFVRGHPDSAPIGPDGAVCPTPDGWQGACPTHPGYRAHRLAAFRSAVREFEIDGIWLDYHHAHSSWEQATPILPDTCFCARCIEIFMRESGVAVPSGAPSDRSGFLLGEGRESWLTWRCAVFTGWVRDLRNILDAERPGALLGTFHCPWTDQERSGALRAKLAIDMRAQADFLDVFSPMPYHARFGHVADVAWIRRQVEWLGGYLGIAGAPDEPKRIWPIVQVADWGESVPVDQVEAALASGSAPPATGVMAFAWHGLQDDEAKQRAIAAYYRRAGD